MAVIGTPPSDSRTYRTPFSRNHKVESFSRKNGGHTEVTVYNWNCQQYEHNAPHPEYTGSMPRLRERYHGRNEGRQKQSPQLTVRHVDRQEENFIFDALNDSPAGLEAGSQDVVSEIEAITQSESNNAEWRYVTREFAYPVTTENVKDLEGFNDKTRGNYDMSQIPNMNSQNSTDNSQDMNEKRRMVTRDKGSRNNYPLVIYGEAGDPVNQHSSPTVSRASTTRTAESSIFDYTNNNGTLSYGIGNISEVDRDDPYKDYEETTEGLGEHTNYLFPPLPKPTPRLLCEFIGYGKCKRTFAPQDFDAWAEHIMNGHLQGKLPIVHLCWFCDDSVFQADDPSDEESIKTNFLRSLSHIRNHLVEDGLQARNIRPDYLLNEHLRTHGLIPDPVYYRVLNFTELCEPFDIVDSTFFPQQEEVICYDLVKEKRYLARQKRRYPQTLLGDDYQNDIHAPPRETTVTSALVNRLRKIFWPRIKENFLRISWNCRCGYPLHIDVPPEQKQAAFDFAQEAAGPSARIQISNNRGNIDPPQESSSGSNIGSGPTTTSWTVSSPSTPIQSHKSTRIFQPPELPPGTKKFLLLCVNTGPYQIRLGHIDLTNVVWDVSLYSMIREKYRSMRGQLLRNMFVVPKTVEYAKFELVKRSNTGECIGNYEKNSIPGKEEVARREYTLSPYPPRIGRVPIQPHVFMHSFLTPGDHLGGLAVQQLPKKVGRKLKCTAQARNPLDVPYGWGIYIVEGLNIFLITLCLGGVIGLLTLVVLLWSTIKGDVQGGTGIGQYGLAVIAIATATFTWKPLKENLLN